MMISDQDIESTEKLLLPDEGHFQEDAREVIRCWHSVDVAACPGSGKTTVLLAKLKLLADRMPLENGAGICVLSHTNVAVDEVRGRLSDYADRLLAYPNYIGTIQSFIDRFVTIPYLRNITGRNVQVVDDLTYAQHMLKRMQNNAKYRALEYVAELNFTTSSHGQFKNRIEHIQALSLQDDGSLKIGKQKRNFAGADTKTTHQYNLLIYDLLRDEGIIRYKDAYKYAQKAVSKLSDTYKDLFSARFRYVFIDEYQDCDDIQRQAIDIIFDATKCTLFKIGDSDQAIYNSSDEETLDWVPKDGYLSIMTSCRYSQEIANVICKLRKDNEKIVTFVGETGIKPVLIIFEPERIGRVLEEFVNVLETHGLHDKAGVYKAIGAVKKETSSGLKIGSYWTSFDSESKKQNEYNYWTLVDNIIANLIEGKLYRAERLVRLLLCRIFHYAKVKHPISGKEFSVVTIKKLFDDDYQDIYRQWIWKLSRLQNIKRETVDCLMRKEIDKFLKFMNLYTGDIFSTLPEYFLDKDFENPVERIDKNIFIEPIRGRRIEFDTIHGVKGETHDATLYLETNRQGSSDLKRILPYYGVGQKSTSKLYDYSRKLAYVGMSRPRKLLCVAMQVETYEKSKGVFKNDWEIIDLREQGQNI